MKFKKERMSKSKFQKLQKLQKMALDSLVKSHLSNTHLSILIVDDNEIFGRYLMATLKSHFPALSFELHYSPKEALNSVIDSPPDLAILDVNMPELNGFQLAKGINSMFDNQIPVLFVSANANAEEDLLDVGLDCQTDFLAKPIGEEMLSAKINYLLNVAS